MASIRMNITLPEEIAKLLKRFAGPREQSAFIAKSIKAHAKLLEHEHRAKTLKEHYLEAASDPETSNLVRDFDSTSSEGL